MNETKRTRNVTPTLSGLSAMAEWQIVKTYLDGISGPRRALNTTKEIRKPEEQLAKVELEIAAETDPVKRLDLVQRRLNVLDWLENGSTEQKLQQAEDAFVEVASSYSYRKGLTYAAWREVGVPARVLKTAGIAPR